MTIVGTVLWQGVIPFTIRISQNRVLRSTMDAAVDAGPKASGDKYQISPLSISLLFD